MKFTPYANEADVLQLGRLSIENRLDRVTLCGDLDLTRDQSGLVHARLLHKLLGEIVARCRKHCLRRSASRSTTRSTEVRAAPTRRTPGRPG